MTVEAEALAVIAGIFLGCIAFAIVLLVVFHKVIR